MFTQLSNKLFRGNMRVRTIVILGLVHTAIASIVSTKNNTNSGNDIKPIVRLVNTTKAASAVTVVTNATQVNKWARDDLDLLNVKTRRKKGKDRSTSSSSGEKASKSGRGDSSLALSSSGSGDDAKSKENKYKEKYINKEGSGWRKWHRQCTQCPEDMVKKWRDQSIKWICGGYQRARRSFKSECMMHYRNCQDGTMFVKIHEHRCANRTADGYRRGKHFFYDYKANLPDDSSSSGSSSSSSSQSSSSSEDY